MSELTQRESEVLRLVSRGLSNDEIAADLDISRRTVETHIRTLFRKTGAARRAQLARLTDEPVVELAGAVLPIQPLSETERGRLRSYAGVVRELTERQFALFEERVEITLRIGEEDDQDTVVERRWTRPKPYLVYRILSPIVAASPAPPELGLVCDVVGKDDIQGDVLTMRDDDDRPLVLVLFQPGLSTETEWVLRYRSPGLWNPLRETGQDNLDWATASLDKRQRPAVGELTLKVVFPPSWSAQQVSERSNLGATSTERLTSGATQVVWHRQAPLAGKYRWRVLATPAE
jgi:DNA-binding CsgD family transcriptional regulator